MNGQVRRDLEHFFGYFRRRLEQARRHEEGTIEGYLIALASLDALSFYESGVETRAESFDELLVRHSGLAAIYRRVSLPLLARYLRLRYPRSFGPIADWVTATYDLDQHYRLHRIRTSDEDPDWDTFWGRVAASGVELPGNTERHLRYYRYARLLWEQYRISAIHRLTIRDEAVNLAEADGPYYMNETVACPQFECAGIGLQRRLAPLMIHSEIHHLPPEILVREIAKALSEPEMGAPQNVVFEGGAQWDEHQHSWTGCLTIQRARHQWLLREIVDFPWVNFGIPRPFILHTLSNVIDGLEAACQASEDLASQLWLNYQRRLR
jgi:hypothetical protein